MAMILINPEDVYVFRTWTEVKKNTSFTKSDFVKHGSHYVCNVTEDTFEISKDIKLLEHVAARKLFTKNKFEFTDLLQIVTLLLVFMVLVS